MKKLAELTDLRVKIISDTLKLAIDAIDEAELEAWKVRKIETRPDADMDAWLMYDPAADAFNVQCWPRNAEPARQPIVTRFHLDGGGYISLFTCTCTDMPEKSWDFDPDLEGWREVLTALREWTMRPREEQRMASNCGGQLDCAFCAPAEEGHAES